MFILKKLNGLVLVLVSVALLTLPASRCPPSTSGTYNPGTGGIQDQGQELCCSAPVPAGFIKYTDEWDPTKCGEPTTITYNVCKYQRYDNREVGMSLEVCSNATNPPGWTTVSTNWDPNKCGHPSSNTPNVKLIQRTS